MEIKNTTENRFGVVAVKGGYITPEQLCEALATQLLEELKGDKHRLIGGILQEKGYITTSEIDVVIEFMNIS